MKNENKIIQIKYQNINYTFDSEEPGYNVTQIVAKTLKKENKKAVCCVLCKLTPVYFTFLSEPTNPNNYICSDCYQKVID